MPVCGGLPRQEGAAERRPLSQSAFGSVCTQDELYNTLSHVFTVKRFSRSKNAETSRVLLHGSVSAVVRALDEHDWWASSKDTQENSSWPKKFGVPAKTEAEERVVHPDSFAFAWLDRNQ